jgi:hypothetical protein
MNTTKRGIMLSAITLTSEADDEIFAALVDKVGPEKLARALYIPPDKAALLYPGANAESLRDKMEKDIALLADLIRDMRKSQA